MWGFWILLCVAFFTESCSGDVLQHGDQLSIKLPAQVKILEFTPLDQSFSYTIWSSSIKPHRGKVVEEKGNNRCFIIDFVSFDDEGTYTLSNSYKVFSVIKVTVIFSIKIQTHMAGETLSISLDGLMKNDASLSFSNLQDKNIMLVKQGSVQNLTDYYERISFQSSSFQVLNVSESDEGKYILFDGKSRQVKVTTLTLTKPLSGRDIGTGVAVLLLLGIAASVCYYYKEKKCSQSTSTTTDEESLLPQTRQLSTSDCPAAPGGPSLVYTPGYPAPGVVICPPPVAAIPVQYAGQPVIPLHNPMYTPGYPAPVVCPHPYPSG
ncbi:uncharacterized protein LOC118809950 isoform X2 [Colossoma macropomum]|nr:uncharacterized protein LOC118809950 isoform X2 [Colossoma macropomum]